MPLLQVKELNSTTKLWVWKISETWDELFHSVALKDVSLARLETMKSESHQKGFLSVRKLLMSAGYTDFDLYYDEFGKPNLKDGKHITISHSNEFSVIVISDEVIGADLEVLKDKIVKIAPRFMEVFHLENLSDEEQIQKATVIWGIKESIFKIKNEPGISFPLHIFEKEFKLEDKKAMAELRFNNKVEHFEVVFDFIENYAFVCAFQSIKN
jgi:phosphopantetheinyl transferase